MEQYQILLLTHKITFFFFFNQGIKVTKFKCSLSKNSILFQNVWMILQDSF